MNIHLFYIAVDAVSIALMLVIGGRFVQQAPKHKNTWLIVLILLGAITYVLSARQDYAPLIPEPYQIDFGSLFPVLNILRNTTTALFMLLCHSIFRDGAPAPKALLGLLALQLFLEEPLDWILGPAWALANPVVSTILYEVVPSVIQLSFLGFALYWILTERDADLVASRRKVRLLLLVIYIVQVVLGLALERVGMALELIPWTAQYPTHVAIVAIGVVTSVVILFLLMSPDAVGVMSQISPSSADEALDAVEPHEPEDTSHADVARIQSAFESERVYQTPGLSVNGLAKHLLLPEYRLRALIHHHMGFRNFNALLHHYRVGEVCEGLDDPEKNNIPILTLALSAGYQSINPFNRAFREIKGMTPSAFRRRQKNDPENSNSTPIT